MFNCTLEQRNREKIDRTFGLRKKQTNPNCKINYDNIYTKSHKLNLNIIHIVVIVCINA